MSSKRVTITLDSDIEQWLLKNSQNRHSLSEKVRICLREYMILNPQRFVSGKSFDVEYATPEYKEGLSIEITDSWQINTSKGKDSDLSSTKNS
jgi:hypothetical protein